MQDFKHIRAWQRGHALAVAVHKATRHFSRLNAGNLRTQLTRSADGIPAAIVEGCGAATNPEFARYLDVAIKSANETEYHLLAARDRELISHHLWQKLSAEVVEVRKMIFGYRKKVLENDRNERNRKSAREPKPLPKPGLKPEQDAENDDEGAS